MKKVLKNRIFLIILTFIVSATIAAYAATQITASEVSYNGMTVKEALDALYSGGGSSSSTIITGLSANVSLEGVSATATVTPTATDNSKIIAYHHFMIEKDNRENIREVVSKEAVVKFSALESYTTFLYYCVAYDINNNYTVSPTTEVTTEGAAIVFKNKYDRYIYIDSNIGDDTNGDGTKNSPYKTLAKIAATGIIQNDYSYGIILNSGSYDLTQAIFTLTNNKSINIIGNRQNTVLSVPNIFGNNQGGLANYTVNIYRLIWYGKPTGPNSLGIRTPLNLYNVAFKFDNASFNTSYFSSAGAHNFYNCTLPYSSSSMFRTTAGTIKLTNCYGGFTSGYNTQQTNWDYQTNTVTQTPQVDSSYRITDIDETWLGNGTGTNPDGSTANRGVYGGTYSWEVDDDLF